MRVAVVGSRCLCVNIAPFMPSGASAIIAGVSPGIGVLASRYADDHGLPKFLIKPGYACTSIDIGKMIVDFADMVVVIWDGRSIDTERIITYAQGKGKKTQVYVINDKDG